MSTAVSSISRWEIWKSENYHCKSAVDMKTVSRAFFLPVRQYLPRIIATILNTNRLFTADKHIKLNTVSLAELLEFCHFIFIIFIVCNNNGVKFVF